MAFTQTAYCYICKEETTHVNNRCKKCKEETDQIESVRWSNLSLEDKVEELKLRLDSVYKSLRTTF